MIGIAESSFEVVGKWSQYLRRRLIGKANCFNHCDSLTLFALRPPAIAPDQSFRSRHSVVRPIPSARLAAARLPPERSRACNTSSRVGVTRAGLVPDAPFVALGFALSTGPRVIRPNSGNTACQSCDACAAA